jgi:hypothetical protein
MRLTGVLLVLAGLGSGADAPRDDAAELARMREAARDALKTSCGRCHDHTQPKARPAALRIFDLQEQDWSARVTDVQMDHMVGRFEGFQMPEADRVIVRRFLDAERARRAALAASPQVNGPGR